VYLCTADRDGMMVSFIQSNYMGFGSGVVVPQLGISMQNRAFGFTLEAGHPNEAAGGKRPRHTIIPGFITRDGRPVGPFGVMGGEMQPQGHLQVLSSMLDHGLNPQAALDAPRWRLGEGLDVSVEPGSDERLLAALAARGHRPLVAPDSLAFGRGQIILRLESGIYAAGSEPRTDGAALGY
jgi:gamma-glutamyltranspeptidase/glutathione hydrolase